MQERRAGTWFGHPKGVFLVAFTELWERFSYFGMAALLALYLASDVASGGWGWNRSEAALFFGFYAGLIFVMPVLGGWITNNYLGERRCILIGALLLMSGHILLGGPAVVPAAIEEFTGVDARAVIVQSDVAFGRVWAVAAIEGLTLDAKIESTSKRYARYNSVRLPAVTTIDAGLRYLQVLGRDATVRLELFNLTNEFSLTPNASGQLTPLDARRFDLSFAFDL